jgi:tetratricopeptide (TPR) repeat protein
MHPHPPADPLQIAVDYLQAGRLPEAESSCRQILAQQPNHAGALRILSLAVENQGQFDEALSVAQRAADLYPQSPENWHRLAEVCVAQRNYSQAAQHWARVAALVPNHPHPHAAWGWVVHELGHFAEAEEHYLASLRCDPNYLLAHLHLADLYSERGEMDRAEQSIRTVLGLSPANPRALARLATNLGSKISSSDQEKIENCLANLNLSLEARSNLLYPLANLFDSRGDYPRAADCANQANALRMNLNQQKNHLDDPQGHERFVDWTIQNFDRDFFARLAGAGNPSTRPVFVFGMPRSGTSLVEQILASHSAVYGAGELYLARDIFSTLPAAAGCSDDPWQSARRLAARGVASLAQQFLAGLSSYDGGCNPRIVDKMPQNYTYLGLLAAMFPNASFIHCRRDLRDVAVSCWLMKFRAFTWADDQSHLAGRIQQYVRLMDHWRQVLPVKVHEIGYESMVANPETHVRQLIAACGLEWEDRCLNFHRTQRPVRTNSSSQIRQPIFNRSVGRWKHYERELADLFRQLPAQP